MNADSRTPPPPYEASNEHCADFDDISIGGNEISASQKYIQSQTIPKSREFSSQQNGCQTNSPIELRYTAKATSTTRTYDNMPTDGSPNTASHNSRSRRRSENESRQDNQKRFIESLSARKSFLYHITVEPVAFLAILALHVELPSIQDLIYTKLCLQIVASHSNQTNAFSPNLVAAGALNRVIDFQVNNATNSSQFSRPASSGRIGGVGGANQSIPSIGDLQGLHRHDDSSQEHFLCDRTNKSLIPAEVRLEIADVDSSFWLTYQIIICLLCALSCPYWGGISDRVGRLVPLNISILAAALGNLISFIFGLLISLDSHALFHVNWLYLGAVLIGLTGGQAVVMMNSFGYVSDNTTSEQRSKRVTILESTNYVSHSVGFLLARYIMKLGLASVQRPWLNRHMVAFGVCVLLNLLAVLYAVACLRHRNFHRFLNNFEREQQEAIVVGAGSSSTLGGTEVSVEGSRRGHTSDVNAERPRELTASMPDDLDGSMAKPEKSGSNWANVLTFSYYRETFEVATRPREARTIILLLLLTGFISAMSLVILMSLLYVYVRMDPFNWNTSQYSTWNLYSSITRSAALVSLSICMRFVKNWRVSDALVAALGFLSKGTGLVMIALADSSAIIYWALLAFVASEFSAPPIRSLLSKLVVRSELGKVYSCLAAIQSICLLFGNIAFYLAYNTLDRQNFFQLSFLVVAGFQFAAVIIMLIIDTTLRRRVMIV